MADVLHAMSIAGGILLFIVGLVVLVSFAAVKRGEAQMQGLATNGRVWWNLGPSPAAVGADGATVVAGKSGIVEISVIPILLFGLGLFVIAVLGLLGLSILEHL